MKTRRKTEIGIAATAAKRSRLRGRLKALVLTALLAWLGGTALRAQCTAENTAFLPGEHVSYNLYFNWKFVWIKVGYADLTVQESDWNGQSGYRFDLLSHTSKKADFFFKMRDTLTCHVGRGLEPLYFCKAAEEGKRHTRDEAWFSYNKGRVNVHQKRTWYSQDRAPQETDYSDTTCVFDMLSILGQARSWKAEDFKVGDKVNFPMATGRKVEPQTLIYRGKENVEAKNDTIYRCLVFSFVEYDKKGEEKEVITFFVSDDDNHLPIRLDMYLSFGSAKAFLTEVKGNRYPLTSAVGKK